MRIHHTSLVLAARNPFLQLPSDASSTVQIWAGHASGHTTVRITPTVTLTPNAPVTIPPSPQPSPTPTAPEVESGSSSESDDDPLPAPTAPTAPPPPATVPPAAVPLPSFPPPSNPPSGTKVYAAYFTLILTTLPLQNFETSQLQASSTELVVRVTNLPDEHTATALVSRLDPYFTSPEPMGFGSQYTKATSPSSAASSLSVLMRESGARVFTIGSLRSLCSLDSTHGLTLSWEIKDDMAGVEL
ncbi:hypothetical protein VYU27_008376 [Nannochloropsis oceanica]